MVAENAFLAAVADFLRSELALPPEAVGVAVPAAATDLPVVVLSLEDLRRGRDGLGSTLPPGPGVVRLSGVLLVEVWGLDAAGAAQLSEGVVEALLSSAAKTIERLVSLDLLQLGSVGAPLAAADHHGRRRSARFRFAFERAVAPIAPEEGVLKTVDVHITDLEGATKPEKPFQVGEKLTAP
ncbi:MAG TPA: hypothetical protein VLB76_12180 [Thermoanaerobaculia bacterium]|jgi:hypothetical protein|nr:hypothetical protein [Thermoanaerobaculia bacterium]